jgi:aliphatic nitrilase
MWNTQIFISRSGAIIGKHQKIMPTNGERMVHAGGHGDTLRAVQTEFGTISGLICGENSNPLAIVALAMDYPVVHVASWPAHFSPGSDMQDASILAARSIAYQLKAFVISSCAIVTDELIEAYGPADEDREQLEHLTRLGGTCIVGPRGKIIAGPMGPGEGILYCDINTQDVIIPKLIHDFAGHYNRSDIFSLTINREAPELVSQRLPASVAPAQLRTTLPASLDEPRMFYLKALDPPD